MRRSVPPGVLILYVVIVITLLAVYFRFLMRHEMAVASFETGLAALAVKQDAEALAALRESERLEPDRAETHWELTSLLARMDRIPEAVAEGREAVHRAPQRSVAHNNYALALLRQGHPDEAIAEAREALRLEPGNAAAHDTLGQALTAKGTMTEALAECQAAVKQQPYSAAFLNSLGYALLLKGDRKKAWQTWRQAQSFGYSDSQELARTQRFLKRYPLTREELRSLYSVGGRMTMPPSASPWPGLQMPK